MWNAIKDSTTQFCGKEMAIPAIFSVTQFKRKKEYVPISQNIYLAKNDGKYPLYTQEHHHLPSAGHVGPH